MDIKTVDTHCHLDLMEYSDDLGDVIVRALEAGVKRMIVPGIDAESSRKAVDIADRFPEVYAAVGIHPHGADKAGEEDIDIIRSLAVDSEKVVAIGEIGLDRYRNYSDIDNQKNLLKDCLDIAGELELPVILHNREADEDMLEILKERGKGALSGVMHCFSGGRDFLGEMLSLGLYVSFAGNITFEKAGALRELIEHVPLEKVLLETDSPYITPEPYRGKRNEPAYVKELTGVYATVHGIAEHDVARITTHNANVLFRLGLEKQSTFTYAIRDALYVNLTYRCTNKCSFCTRYATDYVKGHDLKLDAEPTAEEIISEMRDLSPYGEVVFCGLGEPTLRLGTLKKVAAFVKEKKMKVRVNTNGEGDLIARRNIAGELEGLVDAVSVSVNAYNGERYQDLCRSVFGERSYEAIIQFIRECRGNGIYVEVTCLDSAGEETVSKVKNMAEKEGAVFRQRYLNVVG